MYSILLLTFLIDIQYHVFMNEAMVVNCKDQCIFSIK